MTFFRLILMFSVFAVTSCSLLSEGAKTKQNTGDKKTTNFFINVNLISDDKNNSKKSTVQQSNNNASWQLESTLLNRTEKPKSNYYDFEITSRNSNNSINLVRHKYGNYGKWRTIDKEQYINVLSEQPLIFSIKSFPVSIMKTGKPHGQTLQLLTLDAKNNTQAINLIFGVEKCIAKKEMDFVCF